MTIYILTLALIMFVGLITNPNLSNKKKRRYIIFAFGCLALVSMLRNYTVGRDLTSHYYSSFLRIIETPWNQLDTLGYETGYVYFYKLIGILSSDPQVMIAVHALFVIGVSGWFIYRNSDDVVLSTFIFVATNTWFMYMNIMRQAMAVSICLIAVEILKNKDWKFKRYILYFLIVLLATQFHSSAMIMFLFPILDKIKFKQAQIIVSAVIMFVSFIFYDKIFSVISKFLGGKRDYAEYYSSSGSAINIISIYFVLLYILFFALGCIMIVYYNNNAPKRTELRTAKEKSCQLSDSLLLYAVLALIICRITGLRINIMSRMTFYFLPFLWILAPRALSKLQLASNRKIIKLFVYGLMMIMFLWIGYKNAAVLYGTVPYSFFWE